jgi:hypothetical protein
LLPNGFDRFSTFCGAGVLSPLVVLSGRVFG